jgi:hypothetical protein
MRPVEGSHLQFTRWLGLQGMSGPGLAPLRINTTSKRGFTTGPAQDGGSAGSFPVRRPASAGTEQHHGNGAFRQKENPGQDTTAGIMPGTQLESAGERMSAAGTAPAPPEASPAQQRDAHSLGQAPRLPAGSSKRKKPQQHSGVDSKQQCSSKMRDSSNSLGAAVAEQVGRKAGAMQQQDPHRKSGLASAPAMRTQLPQTTASQAAHDQEPRAKRQHLTSPPDWAALWPEDNLPGPWQDFSLQGEHPLGLHIDLDLQGLASCIVCLQHLCLERHIHLGLHCQFS